MKHLIFLLLILIGCQNRQSDNFKFSYLKNSNPHLKDSTLLKFQLYFDKISYESCSDYLENINKFKEMRNENDDLMSSKDNLVLQMEYLNKVNSIRHPDYYIPRRLKRIKGNLVREETIDTLFYESLTMNGLNYIVENHYELIYGNYISREQFNDINSILLFQYKRELPYYFKNNKFYLNIDFTNLSKHEIEYFKGVIMITDNNNENLVRLELDSRKLKNQNFKSPNILEYWENNFTYKFNLTFNDEQLFYKLNDYSKSILIKNRDTRIVFLPTEINLKNSKTLRN